MRINSGSKITTSWSPTNAPKKLSVSDQNSRAIRQQATNYLTFRRFESAFKELISEENLGFFPEADLVLSCH